MNIKLSLKIIIFLALLTGAMNLFANSQSKAIDQLVEKTMQTFQVPGAAIGIIQNGKVIHLKGYGIANIDSGSAVDKDTIFKIASNSKAFNAAALAILVDQGKLSWDDKVTKYLPDFKMSDPWVTKEFTIVDLLTHRSGLGRFTGDMMIWPEPTKFTRAQVVKNLRHLKLTSSFRSQYAYDNLLYIVAGEVVAAISGQSWEDFVATNIFTPLGMERCYAGGIDTEKVLNLIAPHVLVDDKLILYSPNLINNKTSLMAPAGGIKCSMVDLLKWVNVHLQEGLMEDGRSFISLQQRDKLWKTVTPLNISERAKQLDKTHYRGYALGWYVNDFHGRWLVSHTGTLSGSASRILLLPDQNLGVILLLNQDSNDARNALSQGILQEFTTKNDIDWVDYYQKVRAEKELKKQHPSDQSEIYIIPEEIAVTDTTLTGKLLGTYADPWFGKISLSRNNDSIRFQSEMVPRLKGTVFFHQDNQWWVKWDDRSFRADAWLSFDISQTSKDIGLLMKAIHPDADRGFDYKDLDFIQQ